MKKLIALFFGNSPRTTIGAYTAAFFGFVLRNPDLFGYGEHLNKPLIIRLAEFSAAGGLAFFGRSAQDDMQP